MPEILHWIWLSRIENVKRKIILELLERYETPERLWNVTAEELFCLGIPLHIAEKIVDIKYKENLDKYLRVYAEEQDRTYYNSGVNFIRKA